MAEQPNSMNEHSEEWRAVLGWEGFYEASSLGRVRSVDRVVSSVHPSGRAYSRVYRSKVLRPRFHRVHGYPSVFLSRKGEPIRSIYVHILVCEAFHGARPDGMVAAHGDGSKTNCRADNLRWATFQENMADCLIHGTHNRGVRSGHAKLDDDKAREILSHPSRPYSYFADKFGVSITTVKQVRDRTTWRHVSP